MSDTFDSQGQKSRVTLRQALRSLLAFRCACQQGSRAAQVSSGKKAEYCLRRALFLSWNNIPTLQQGEIGYRDLLREVLACGLLQETGEVAFPLVALSSLAVDGTATTFPAAISRVLSGVESEQREYYVTLAYSAVLSFVGVLMEESHRRGNLSQEARAARDCRLQSLREEAEGRLRTGTFCFPPDLAGKTVGWGYWVDLYYRSPARAHLLECTAALLDPDRATLSCPHGPRLWNRKMTPSLLRTFLLGELLLRTRASHSALVGCTLGDFDNRTRVEAPDGGVLYTWLVAVELPHRFEQVVADGQLVRALLGYRQLARPLLIGPRLLDQVDSPSVPLFPSGGTGRMKLHLLPLANLILDISGCSRTNRGQHRPLDLAAKMRSLLQRQRADLRRLFF
jgi:hypothetical protein